MRYLSPLRYPGGKARLAPYIERLIDAQSPRPRVYVEPFAGGAGAALHLLVREQVSSIHINDLDPGIFAFWNSVFSHTDELVHMIRKSAVDLETWEIAREVYRGIREGSELELGFSTFLLNRCNRSGILTAGPIGGHSQNGKWKIDARFNRDSLIDRIQLLGKYRNRVKVTCLDARELLRKFDADERRCFLYVDPPYLEQGEHLYFDRLTGEDHEELASMLRGVRHPWFLTYDVDDRITDMLYRGLRVAHFSIAHTAQVQHIGSEYAVFSDNMAIPSLDVLRRSEASWV